MENTDGTSSRHSLWRRRLGQASLPKGIGWLITAALLLATAALAGLVHEKEELAWLIA